eukprot:m.1441998 g.1441998  ORF g.1441998 m.1441998 type:complete len:1035 (+) comp25095_c0_seq15:369-3473(+)
MMSDTPEARTSVFAALDVMALFDFEGQSAEELSFMQGERLQVLKADPRKKWWYAMDSHKRKGYIPVNFVSFVNDEDRDKNMHPSDNALDREGEAAENPGKNMDGSNGESCSNVEKNKIDGSSGPGDDDVHESLDSCQTPSRKTSGTLTSVRFIEDLLLFKLRSKVITQAEYDQIMETRRSARELMNADGMGEFVTESAVGDAVREDFVSPLVSSSNDVSAEGSADDDGTDNDDGGVAFPNAVSPTAPSPLSARAASAPPPSSSQTPRDHETGAGPATPLVELSPDNHAETTAPRTSGAANDGQQNIQDSKQPRRGSNFSLFGGGTTGGKKKPKKKKTSKPRLGEILVVHPWMQENETAGQDSVPAVKGSKMATGRAPEGPSQPSAEGSTQGSNVTPRSADTTGQPDGAGDHTTGAPMPRSSVASQEVDTAAEAKWKKLEAKRLNVVNEILSTERYYVSILKMLLDAFVKPLRQAAQLTVDQVANKIMNTTGKLEYTKTGVPKVVISDRQVRVIFHEVESLHAINNLLLEQLEERYSKWSAHSTLGDIFLSIMSFLKGYTAFANNFENALKVISDCKKEPSFVAYLSHCAENVVACNKMWLEDHMITPIQRIPRYILLLSDLMKHTHETHPDHQLLAQCVVSMKAIARHINESKKRSEEVVKTIQVQRIVKRCPAIVTPSRMFLLECGCAEMAPLDTKEAKAIVDRGAVNDDAGVAAATGDNATAGGDGRDAPSPVRRGSYMGSVRSASGGGRAAALARSTVSPVSEMPADDNTPPNADVTVGDATTSTATIAPTAPDQASPVCSSCSVLHPGGNAAVPSVPGQADDAPCATRAEGASHDKDGLAPQSPSPTLPGPARDNDVACADPSLVAGPDSTAEGDPPAVSREAKRSALFAMRNEVALYLFNDALLVATHVRITDLWGKAFESFKTMNRDLFGKDMPVRTVTMESDGNETVHKYKFQRLESLDLISLSDFPSDDLLPNGFVIHFPDGPFYYSAPNPSVKAAFLKAFTDAADSYSRHQTEQIQALQKAFSEA